MNILFLLYNYKIGGVETVTHILANEFSRRGYHVVIYSINDDSKANIQPPLNSDVKLLIGSKCFKNHTQKLRQCLIDNGIDVIINQSGHLYHVTKIAKDAAKGLHIKLISEYHNIPGWGSMPSTFKEKFSYLKGQIKMRLAYEMSDVFVLLSETFRDKFNRYVFKRDSRKAFAIPNPVCQSIGEVNSEKDNTVLYVGRLERTAKRVDRVLDVWENVQPRFPSWHLQIVGDGPDRTNLEQIAIEKGLKNVEFLGFQNPLFYYQKSPILIMTSDYEGFPLILLEAMTYGVVPIVYNSFDSLSDVVNYGVCGLVSNKVNGQFDLNDFVEKLTSLMNSKEKRNVMSENVKRQVEKFSPSKIGDLWEKILR